MHRGAPDDDERENHERDDDERMAVLRHDLAVANDAGEDPLAEGVDNGGTG